MKNNKRQQQEPKDVALDVPAEANTEKHINFLKIEEAQSTLEDNKAENVVTERQKEWNEGLEAGERARHEDSK